MEKKGRSPGDHLQKVGGGGGKKDNDNATAMQRQAL